MFYYKPQEEEGLKHFKEGADTYTFYGQREVPNIKLTMIGAPIDSEDKEYRRSVILDTLAGYYEKYDSVNGLSVVIEVATLSPELYSDLHRQWKLFLIESQEQWREQDVNIDKIFLGMRRTFSKMSIEHELTANGKPTTWIITLSSCFNIEENRHKEIKNSIDRISNSIVDLRNGFDKRIEETTKALTGAIEKSTKRALKERVNG